MKLVIALLIKIQVLFLVSTVSSEDFLKWMKYADGERCSNAVIGGYWPGRNETVFIGRHRVDENLLLGKLVPIEKTLYIPWQSYEKTFSEYEVLCSDSVEWVPANSGNFPSEAVVGTDIGQETVYICRASVYSEYVGPGMLRPSHKTCYIGDGGRELRRVQYEVLVHRSKTDGPKWVKYADGEKCPNAIIGGYWPGINETVFVGRHRVDENLLLGVLVPIEYNLYIPWKSINKKKFSEYEVLCGGVVEWVPANFGQLPKGAVVGTVINTDIGPENIYICRAPVLSEYVSPGMFRPSHKTCYIGDGGRELQRVQYEVLVQHSTTACECDPTGSLSSTCEETSKTCKCKPNVVGLKCDRCAPNRYKFGPQGCKVGPTWLQYSDGDKCSNAVVGGYDISTNETLFIARRPHDTHLIPGKLVPSLKSAFFAVFVNEFSSPEYEVLCDGGSTKWISASYGDVPEDAVVGGVVSGGIDSIGPEVMNVCRTLAPDGSKIPGWVTRSKNFCSFAYKGGEHFNEIYEILQGA